MDFKQILLILAVIIISFVFYLQLKTGCVKREGLATDTNHISNADQEKCENANYAESRNLPLREYYIKSSYNTAFDGTATSCSNIIARLAEGYRFIDFNVFSASGDDVYVGFSNNNTPELSGSTEVLRFSDALNCVAKNAFVKPQTPPQGSTPVSWDYTNLPLIVNIRVFRAMDSTVDIIAKVANIISPNSGSSVPGAVTQPSYSANYYVDGNHMPIKVDSCTPLSDISKKIVFTMNIQNILEVYTPSAEYASKVPDATITAINTFTNFLSGGSTCPAYYNYADVNTTVASRTNELIHNNDNPNVYQTNVRYMMLVFPHPTDTIKHPNIRDFAIKSSVLILPMRVYLGDDASGTLALNTHIFDTDKSAFVPASNLIVTENSYQAKSK